MNDSGGIHLDMEPHTIEKLIKIYCDATGTPRFRLRDDFVQLAEALQFLPDNHRRDEIVRRIEKYDGKDAASVYDSICALTYAQEHISAHPVLGQLEQHAEYVEDTPQTDFAVSAFYALTKR